MPAHARNPPHKHSPAHLKEFPALLSAPLALPPSTSLPQPRPPAWTALLATPPMALAQPSWLSALDVLLGSMLQLESAPPALSPHTSLPLAPPPAWTALLATSLLALALFCCLTAQTLQQTAPVGPTWTAPGASPLAEMHAQWLTMMANHASKTHLGTMKPTRTAPSPTLGLGQ